MNLVNRIDWFVRFKCQALLNLLGKKLGVTKKSATLNTFIAFIVSYCWIQRHGSWAMMALTVFVVLLNLLLVGIFLYFCGIRNGEHQNWEIGRTYRWTLLILLALL